MIHTCLSRDSHVLTDSTIGSTGDAIPIEERSPTEVQGAFGTIWAPTEARVYNPAFDVTPVQLVTSLVLDTGVYTQEQINSGVLHSLKSQQKN